MKAVNLIPLEERRGSAGTPARTGQAPYLLLGALALAVVLLAATVLTSRSVSDKRAQVTSLDAQIATEQSSASRLKTYVDLGAQRDQRTATVRTLVKGRFNWASVMREVARTLPKGASLTGLDATGGTVAAPTPGSPASAASAPSLKVTGCTAGQGDVALMMVDLRRMNGVEKVALNTSTKGDNTATSASGDSATTTDCRAGSSQRPQFTMTVTFKALAAPPAPAAATATGTTGTTTSASSTTASTTTPTPSTEAVK